MLREPDENLADTARSTVPESPALAGPPSLADAGGIVRPAAGDSDSDWRRALAKAIRDPFELCERLKLPRELANPAAAADFPVLVPEGFLRRMRPEDPKDPLLLQVLPTGEELLDATSPADAVGDLEANPRPGLLHKYEGRVLMTLGTSCAVNCRYCFRRHFPYSDSPHAEAAWEPALDYIRADPSLHEVILSGGDPLVNGDARLERLVARLDSIPHVQSLRIHTRTPIVLPERVTTRLASLLKASRLNAVVVLHINHANEVDESVVAAMDRFLTSGVILLNQSVLLKGVNDSVEALVDLSQKLIATQIVPYYLHQIDRVPGSVHFEAPTEQGVRLVEAMRKRLPGYAIPRYVQEVAGHPHKVVLA